MNPSNCARWSAWLVPLMVLGGCTSAKGSAVDAKGSAPDATPATDVAQVCESFDPCMDASVVDGQCSISVAPDGQACSSATGPCAATCQGGVCVQPVCMASGGPCYEAIGQCTSSGECQSVPKPAGTSCTASVGPGACKTSAGTCDGNGFCNAAPAAPGAPCTLAASAIGANNCLDYFKAVCDENGACHATVKEGSPCDFGCGYDANAGVCDATGKCKPDPAAGPVKCSISMVINGPNNAMKTVYDQNPCLEGHCGDDGSCQPVALLGKACTPVDLDGSQCQNNFTCDAKGFCSGPVAPGQACNPHAGPCYPGGLCAADGSCTPIPAPGKACVTDDPCRPSGTCNATGECIAPVAVGAICGAAPGACWQKTCQSDGSCKQVANPGAACTVDMNPCKPGTCQSDGSCTAAIKVGAPCPTGDPCTTGTCDSAGTCAATVQTGKSCWTGSGDGACLDDGICQAPCKAGATCKGACGAGLCDATGHCLTPGDAGKSCSPYKFEKACSTVCTCNAKGGVDVANVPDGTSCNLGGECGTGAVCVSGHCLMPPDADAECPGKGPCSAAHCCKGEWGGFCLPDAKPGTCTYSQAYGTCGSGCFAGACQSDSTGDFHCFEYIGMQYTCQNDCNQKCMPTSVCTFGTPNYAADGCPCSPSLLATGGYCGYPLVCKAGQCILN